jgi:hypothetical protein
MMMAEHHEQAALIDWARQFAHECPELELLHAIPLGGLRPSQVRLDPRTGHQIRYSPAGQKLRAEGAKEGVPDLCLPVAREAFYGLYIEMKYGRNKPTHKQDWWIARLRGQGYRVEVCWSFEEARDVLIDYLGLEDIAE